LHKPPTISAKLLRTSLCALYESKTFRKNFHQNNLMIFCRPPYSGIVYMISFRFFKLFHFFNYHSSIYWSSFLRKSSDYVIRGYTPDLYIWKKFLFYASGVSPPLTDSIFFGSKTSESVNRGVPLLTDTTRFFKWSGFCSLWKLYSAIYLFIIVKL
jgi:hypothetical protein